MLGSLMVGYWHLRRVGDCEFESYPSIYKLNERIKMFVARRNFGVIKKNDKFECFGGLVAGVYDGRKNVPFNSKWHFKFLP